MIPLKYKAWEAYSPAEWVGGAREVSCLPTEWDKWFQGPWQPGSETLGTSLGQESSGFLFPGLILSLTSTLLRVRAPTHTSTKRKCLLK